jgi:hypothetical protein
MKIVKETVTPEQAMMWLQVNDHNRRLQDKQVEAIARDIRAGDWQLTGDSIKFDKSGRLLDGQHRLAGVVRADLPIETMIVLGLEPEAQRVMDTGLRRSVAQQLTMDGFKYGTQLAATATLALRWEVENIVLSGTRYKVTASEQFEWLDAHPEALDYQPGSVRLRGYLGGGSASALAFSMWHTAENVDEHDAKDFWRAVETGAELKLGDPRLALREGMLRRNADRSQSGLSGQGFGQELIIFLVARAWNAFRDGKDLKIIKLGKRDEQPRFK